MRNRNSNQLLPTLPPVNFWSGTKKIAIGGLLLFAADLMPAEEAWKKDVIRYAIVVGSATLAAGMQSLLDNTMLWYSKNVSIRSNRRNSRGAVHPQVQQTATYYQLQKYQNVLVNAFHCFSTIFMLYRYFAVCLALPNYTALFSFSFPKTIHDNNTDNVGTIFSFFHMPLIILPMMAFSIIAVVYNIKELLLNLNSRYPRQGNSPFFGFLNAFSQVSLTAAFGRKLTPSNDFTFSINPQQNLQEQLALMQQIIENNSKTPKLAFLVHLLNAASAYQVYQNAVTLLFNVIYAFVSRPEIEIEVKATDTPTSKKRRKSVREQQRRNQSTLFQSPKPEEDLPQIHCTTTTSTADTESSVEQARRHKVKTRGVAGEGYSASTVTSERIETLPSVVYDRTSNQRTVKLDLINDLRHFSQIKEHLISRELTHLRKFLPKGQIVDTTGSEHVLTWEWQDKKYRIKYETPHGRGTNNIYKGRKLHKILNILETGYLWGWGQENIQAYMVEHNSSHYLGTLANILLRRPDFDEPELPTTPRM